MSESLEAIYDPVAAERLRVEKEGESARKRLMMRRAKRKEEIRIQKARELEQSMLNHQAYLEERVRVNDMRGNDFGDW